MPHDSRFPAPEAERPAFARFKPTTAIAACGVEEVMYMSNEKLASVAWPLLTNAERASSMKDIFFTPPARVSSSPRATESTFLKDIVTVVTELTGNVQHFGCGETPMSTAHLRAAALAFFILPSQGQRHAAHKSSLQPCGGCRPSVLPVADGSASSGLVPPITCPPEHGHLPVKSSASCSLLPSTSADIYDFAVPPLAELCERDTQEPLLICGAGTTSIPTASGPETPGAQPQSRRTPAPAGGAGSVGPTLLLGNNAELDITATPDAAILPPDNDEPVALVEVEGGEGGLHQSEAATSAEIRRGGSPTTGPAATLQKGNVARPAPDQTATVVGRETGDERDSYERKKRCALSEQMEAQWERVVASALQGDDAVSVSEGAGVSATASPASAATVRQRMLRTAVLLCQLAPLSNEAGHSFACLLKLCLCAVATTDSIRATEHVMEDDADEITSQDPHFSSPATEQRGCAAQKPSLNSANRAKSHDQEGGEDITGMALPTSATSPPARLQCSALIMQQAALWLEVVLPMVHCVALVQWTPDTSMELGRILESVTAEAPAKLIAVAQQQRQGPRPSHLQCFTSDAVRSAAHTQRNRGGRDLTSTSPNKTAPPTGVSAASSPKRMRAKTSPLALPLAGTAEHIVNFSVCIPFEIGPVGASPPTGIRLRDISQWDASRRSNITTAQNSQPCAGDSLQSCGGHLCASYPSSAFHEVPDVQDGGSDTENAATETSTADVEESESFCTSVESGSEGGRPSDLTSLTSTASAVGVAGVETLSFSASSDEDGDEGAERDTREGEKGRVMLFNSPTCDFDALPCRRSRTQMLELVLPSATHVSVKFTSAVCWDRMSRARDVLLLPLESEACCAEKCAAATASAARSRLGGRSEIGGKRTEEVALPMSLQALKTRHRIRLSYGGPCRILLPNTARDPNYSLKGEVCATVALPLDTRWGNEWTVALSTARRTLAERLLTNLEQNISSSESHAHIQQHPRRSSVAGSLLLRGGLKNAVGAAHYGTRIPSPLAGNSSTTFVASTAATHVTLPAAAQSSTVPSGTYPALDTATALLDPFLQSLLEMPVPALRAKARCHTAHADGVRATLMVIAHVLLRDRPGYSHGDPLTWRSPVWSDAVRQVSLASNAVGVGCTCGAEAIRLARFIVSNVVPSITASVASARQVVDAAIELFSTPQLTVSIVKTALEYRCYLGNTMWVVVDLLSKCLTLCRAPRHVALVSLAVRRLLLVGSAEPAHYLPSAPTPSGLPQAGAADTLPVAVTAGSPPGPSGGWPLSSSLVSTSSSAAVATMTASATHYLVPVGGCGRATEANLRRGVQALLSELFRLLRALLHRSQSTQTAPHRFLLEPWAYTPFAVLTISLMSTPMDAADVQACAPFFAEVVKGLLPSFTRLSRTESLPLSDEAAERNFMVEVARYVQGRITPPSFASATEGGGGGAANMGDGETVALWEPRIVRRYRETAGGNTVTAVGSAPSSLVEGGHIWDVIQGSTSSSWAPGHVRIELWNGSGRGFFVGLASVGITLSSCTPEGDPNGIYFMGDGTIQFGVMTRQHRRLPRWHAGDVVELNFVFARCGWHVILALNGVSLVRVELPRRDFRLVTNNVRTGEYVRGREHMHVLSVSPVHYWEGGNSNAVRQQGGAGSRSMQSQTCGMRAPADVRLYPFARPTMFNLSLFLHLVLHYLILRIGNPARTLAAPSGPVATCSLRAVEGANLVHACTASLQYSVQQLVRVLKDLGNLEDGDGVCHAKAAASRHVLNAMLLDLVVTLSIAVLASPAHFSSHVDLLTSVVECDIVTRKTRSVALSTLYNAISQYSKTAGVEVGLVASQSSVLEVAGQPTMSVGAEAVRRLWDACFRLASHIPGYRPRFSAVSAPSCITVLAGGRRIEHKASSGAFSAKVQSTSYACNPIDLADPTTSETVRVSVRLQRGFSCETMGRYYYFGLAEVVDSPPTAPLSLDGELTLYPGERLRQLHSYYISDYLSEVPNSVVQRWDTERAKNYFNPDLHIVFGSGDVITAVVYVRERCIGFERNGLPLNFLYRGIPISVRYLFPFVEMYNRDSRAKWMYPPDEVVMCARYTMRGMLQSWTPLVLPVVKEHLRIGDDAAEAVPSTPSPLTATMEPMTDVTLGVLGADGDEFGMVYVIPPQLDHPGGRSASVRLERFEGTMALVCDEPGSVQRVCAAALEPNPTKEPYALPASVALSTCVQACLPELVSIAVHCLANLKGLTSSTSSNTSPHPLPTEEVGGATLRQHFVLQHPTTLLRALRLLFSSQSSSRGTSGSQVHSNARGVPHPGEVEARRGERGDPRWSTSGGTSSAPSCSTSLAAQTGKMEWSDLLPLLYAVLPAAQLALPPPILLREAWNELWCDPHLCLPLPITLSSAAANAVPVRSGDANTCPLAGGAESGAPSMKYTDPAFVPAPPNTKAFEAPPETDVSAGTALLCPTCGKRWSSCKRRHPVPSSWCDLLDRILGRLRQRLPRQSLREQRASPYCSWFTDWTDAPLDESPHTAVSAQQPRGSASAEDAAAMGDDAYHSPASAHTPDATLWEDVSDDDDGVYDEEGNDTATPVTAEEEDATEETAGSQLGHSTTSSSENSVANREREPSSAEESDEERDDEEEEEANDGGSGYSALSASSVVPEAWGCMAMEPRKTLTVRRSPSSVCATRAVDGEGAVTSAVTEPTVEAEDDERVFVEGSGEVTEASFSFSGFLVSRTVLRGVMVFDQARLTPTAADAVVDQEWACSMCTFLNEPSAVRCAVCFTARPGASWTCLTCTYAHNSLSSTTCMTCGGMRPDSVRRQQAASSMTRCCTTCHAQEHYRDFSELRYRSFCTNCQRVTRWLPKEEFSAIIEARLVGDGDTLEYQWELDGLKTVCFGLRTRAYSAGLLWDLVDAAARRLGSSASAEVRRYVFPIPEQPLSTQLKITEQSTVVGKTERCVVGAIVHYASALVLQYAALLPPQQLAEPAFLERIHVCYAQWLDSWAQFPASTVMPIFYQCLTLLQKGVREAELVATLCCVAHAILRFHPELLHGEKDALLYALCRNVVRYGDSNQRKISYACVSALIEDGPCSFLNVQPVLPVLAMKPLLDGQQRTTVLALLHRASMRMTSSIAKAAACLTRTITAMERCRALPPMLGHSFPYLVALSNTRLNEGEELLMGQVRGSIGVAPTKGGKYYYELEVPPKFTDRSKTVVMGWGTLEHERMASAQHVGSDLHSWGYNCRENLRLMMMEQALPVPRHPRPGDVIGSMIDLETMMVCWTINGREISWVSVPAQGDGEEIFPYVSASVEPHSVKIRLGNTHFKPAGYSDYSPPPDRELWGSDDTESDDSEEDDAKPHPQSTQQRTRKRAVSPSPATPPPQSYEFYQQLSGALEEASIIDFKSSAVLPLLDTATVHGVLRQYPLVMRVAGSSATETASSPTSVEVSVTALLPYIAQLRSTQEMTIVVARHVQLIEGSPYLMSCYRKATDLLFSSGRWAIFELQPGGRPKYHSEQAHRVLVSLQKADEVRAEVDAAWLAEHPELLSATKTAAAPFYASLRHIQPDDDADRSPLQPTSGDAAGGDADATAGNIGAASPSRASDVVDDDREDAEEESAEEGDDFEDTDDASAPSEDSTDGGTTEGEAAPTGVAPAADDRDGSGLGRYGDAPILSLMERRLLHTVTGQLFTQLEKTRVYQRARMFVVQLEGALTLDAGGVSRAMMSTLGDEMSYRFIDGVRVDPLVPLFELCRHSTVFTVVPNMPAFYASEATDDGGEGGLLRRMFEWLGRMIGNIVLCGTVKVSFDFPRMMWKALTFQEDTITLEDFAYDVDDNIIATLEDPSFVLSDGFFASLPAHVRASSMAWCTTQGSVVSGGMDAVSVAAKDDTEDTACRLAKPLRPYACMTPSMSIQDMSQLALEELEELAANAEDAEVRRRRTLVQEALLHQYDPVFLLIRAGLTSVVPVASLRTVHWEDLRTRVCGNCAISCEHVLAELDMSPLSPSMQSMLTEVLRGFSASQLARFLLFCSGQSRLPLPEKVLVDCGDERGRFPTAHTCSPTSLLLQPCTTAGELRRDLEACLTHAAEFGFV